MKFSIIIPVYNVEKYIEKCLNNIIHQTYDNFEVIVVNDGTKDDSQKIINKFVKKDKRIKSFIKENGGLSSARNYGLKEITGDYIVFIDSDDYIEKDYLFKVNELLENHKKIDVVKIKLNIVDEEGNLLRKENGLEEGYVDFKELTKLEFLEPSWSYIYKSSYWKKNNFKFMEGKIHEDFGLTPEILIKAKNIYYLDYYGYNYVQRENSIMSANDKNKIKKKAFDILEQYDRLISLNIKTNELNKRYYDSFLSNAVISKEKTLDGEDKKIFHSELKKRKVADKLLDDSFKRKLKKILQKIKYII